MGNEGKKKLSLILCLPMGFSSFLSLHTQRIYCVPTTLLMISHLCCTKSTRENLCEIFCHFFPQLFLLAGE